MANEAANQCQNGTVSNPLFSEGLNVTSLYESWIMFTRLTTMLAIEDVTLKQCTNLLVSGNFIRNMECNQYICGVFKGFWLHPRLSFSAGILIKLHPQIIR